MSEEVIEISVYLGRSDLENARVTFELGGVVFHPILMRKPPAGWMNGQYLLLNRDEWLIYTKFVMDIFFLQEVDGQKYRVMYVDSLFEWNKLLRQLKLS